LEKERTKLGEAVTRGHGLLEPWLAQLRSSQANRMIPAHLRPGRILDIGCGSHPYFLSHTYFSEKFALDQLAPRTPYPEIQWHTLNLNHIEQMPFDPGFFSVVTLLAVTEHLDPNALVILFAEIYRILKPGGMLLITTPAAWTDSLLHWMAALKLVSKEEINEHVYAYTLPLLGWYFGKACFAMEKVHFGYFEAYLNMWATAYK
jgi:SAM-dependent methyltransferase